MKRIPFTVAGILLAFIVPCLYADSEIAVSIRYLQAEGVSHSQLYLYREDGKLLRQLTKEKTGQVTDPLFAPDGETIVFKRVAGKVTEYWSMKPKGEDLHKLSAQPSWYSEAKASPCFIEPSYDEDLDKALSADLHFPSPDGAQELVLKHNTEEENKQSGYETSQYGKHFQLHDLKSGKVAEFGKMEGFMGSYGVLYLDGKPGNVFLTEPPLHLVFSFIHLNSTDGDTVLAVDLDGMRFTRLSPNWAMPVPLPGEAAFLTIIEARYQPIPGSPKTANCSYLEHWDSNFKKIRYGGDTAAICYGASMYRPGKKPAVVNIPASD